MKAIGRIDTHTNPNPLETNTRTQATINMTGSLLYSTVYKATKSAPLGLGLWANPSGQVAIAHVADHGLFARKKLKAGMKIESINDIPCDGLSLEEIEFCLAELTGTVSIAARSPVFRLPCIAELSEDEDGVSSVPLYEETPSKEQSLEASAPKENQKVETPVLRLPRIAELSEDDGESSVSSMEERPHEGTTPPEEFQTKVSAPKEYDRRLKHRPLSSQRSDRSLLVWLLTL